MITDFFSIVFNVIPSFVDFSLVSLVFALVSIGLLAKFFKK